MQQICEWEAKVPSWLPSLSWNAPRNWYTAGLTRADNGILLHPHGGDLRGIFGLPLSATQHLANTASAKLAAGNSGCNICEVDVADACRWAGGRAHGQEAVEHPSGPATWSAFRAHKTPPCIAKSIPTRKARSRPKLENLERAILIFVAVGVGATHQANIRGCK